MRARRCGRTPGATAISGDEQRSTIAHRMPPRRRSRGHRCTPGCCSRGSALNSDHLSASRRTRDLLLERDLEAAAGAERHRVLTRVDEVVGLRRDVRRSRGQDRVRPDHRTGHEPQHEREPAQVDVLVGARRQRRRSLRAPSTDRSTTTAASMNTPSFCEKARGERHADVRVRHRRWPQDRAP